MRFHNGPVPENPDFHPEAEGWQGIRDTPPKTYKLLSIPVTLVMILVWTFSIYIFVLPHVTDAQLPQRSEIIKIGIWWLLTVIPMIPLTILLPILALPKLGLSSDTIVGYWPQQRFLYVHYDGAMSRNRLILVALVPVIVLFIIPLILMAIFPTLFTFLVSISFWGAVFSTSGMLSMNTLLYKIPPFTIIRNQGWKTYWKFGG